MKGLFFDVFSFFNARCGGGGVVRFLRAAVVVGALSGVAMAQAPAEHPGAVIYKKLCVDCHGKNGEGVKDKYDEPLHGNRTVEALAKRIARTMPDDNVGACVGEDAAQVSAYIYEAFYSPKAFARLHVPEFDLARLTIAQYRTSVADVVGRFRPGFDKPPGKERGLKAHYSGFPAEKPPRVVAPVLVTRDVAMPMADAMGAGFVMTGAGNAAAAENGARWTMLKRAQTVTLAAARLASKKDEKQKQGQRTRFDQKDAQVAFKFGEESPDPEKLAPDEFSIRWEGSVFAEETGTYEFIVKSENGVRLSVNNLKTPIIDGWVASGAEVRELKKSIFLLGGRSYPIQVEFFKFKENTASIRLEWKPPHGVVQAIPAQNFSPDRLRETMIVKTTFPADDRSAGYERGTGVSKSWDQATTEAALDVAEHVDDHLDELSGTKVGAPDRVEKLKQFARKFAEAAFRRPLSEADYQHFIEHQFQASKTPDVAVKRVVLFALKSPRFLYPDLPSDAAPDGYEIAARLALNLWDSIPDVTLLKAAAEGKLQKRTDIVAQANRMIGDPRTKVKLHGFFHHWLELERAESISKDPKAFPNFDAAVLSDLRSSLWLFVDQVVWSDKSDYRELLQADYLLLNERLAKLYGKSVTGEGFQKVSFDPKQRAGVVTHPYLLAAFASSKATSPIHRGVFLTRNIVGMTLKPPPMAVAFEDAKFDAHLTMREKITELTKNGSCMGCHRTINPLGFSLENYDAIGRWRTKEGDKPINAVTDFATDEGQTIRLTGARDLVKFAAESADGHRAFIHQLFEHTAKQNVNVYGPDTLEDLRLVFSRGGFNVRKLLSEIAVIAAMRDMPEPTPAPAAPAPVPAAAKQAAK